MVEIFYLGSCSGTEPFAGMHHCSLILRVGGVNYWFDAGENCSHFAHNLGIDLLSTRALFVSHPHIDHIGGLAGLLGAVRKLVQVEKRTLGVDNTLEVYFPDLGVFDAVKTVVTGDVADRSLNYNIKEKRIADGTLFEDENVRVTAIHNGHLRGEDGSRGWRSFSFLVGAEGKRIVISGDVMCPEELDGLVPQGADLMIMETGHHKVADVLAYAEGRGVKRLRFNHHGREIIGGRLAAERKVREFSDRTGIDTRLCYDGMIERI